MLSINQTAAQITLQEVWKASLDNKYPINLKRKNQRGGDEPARNTRLSSWEMMTEGGKTNLAERSFAIDTGKLWNQTPIDIKGAAAKRIAKKLIRGYYKTLPIYKKVWRNEFKM